MYLKNFIGQTNEQTSCKYCHEDYHISGGGVAVHYSSDGKIFRVTLDALCSCEESDESFRHNAQTRRRRAAETKTLVFNFVSRIIHFDPMPKHTGKYFEDGKICEIDNDLLQKIFDYIMHSTAGKVDIKETDLFL